MSDMLGETIRSFKENLNDLMNTQLNTIDNRIHIILKEISSGLDKLNLERNLIKGFTNDDKRTYELLDEGSRILADVKTELNKNDDKSKIIIHMMKLLRFYESTKPFFKQAQARLDSYSDRLGATDRYLGYRNNLTRFNTVIHKPRSVWEDTTQVDKFSTPDYREESLKYQKNENSRLLNQREPNESYSISRPSSSHFINTTLDRANLQYQTDRQKEYYTRPKTEHDLLIEYGMHPVYPDKSEYTYSFVRPTSHPVHYAPITINPQPSTKNFTRPLATHKIEPRHTEYQLKFKFPDGKQIRRYPWIH